MKNSLQTFIYPHKISRECLINMIKSKKFSKQYHYLGTQLHIPIILAAHHQSLQIKPTKYIKQQ